MARIALSGNIGSGKSTIAKALEGKGFYLLNYTELIKEEVAHAMTGVGVTKTFEEAQDKIHKEKEFYRPLLIAWADTCGWSDGTHLLSLLPTIYEKNIVMDNIRFLAQAKIAKEEGFYILKLEGGERMDIPELLDYHFDAIIPWMENVDKRAEYIMELFS